MPTGLRGLSCPCPGLTVAGWGGESSRSRLAGSEGGRAARANGRRQAAAGKKGRFAFGAPLGSAPGRGEGLGGGGGSSHCWGVKSSWPLSPLSCPLGGQRGDQPRTVGPALLAEAAGQIPPDRPEEVPRAVPRPSPQSMRGSSPGKPSSPCGSQEPPDKFSGKELLSNRRPLFPAESLRHLSLV